MFLDLRGLSFLEIAAARAENLVRPGRTGSSYVA
jgi:hypothetical protein